MQNRITNPGDMRSEALHQAVFGQMGITNFYDMERAKERGLNDPRFLPSYMRFLLKNTPDRNAAQYSMKQDLGIGMLQSDALFKQFPRGITERDMGKVKAILEGGKGKLASGAAAAMGLPGNQLRKIESSIHDLMISGAEPLVQYAADQLSQLTDIAGSSKTTAEKVGLLADHVLGQKPGTSIAAGRGLAKVAKEMKHPFAPPAFTKSRDFYNAFVGGEGYGMGPMGPSIHALDWKKQVRFLAGSLGGKIISEDRPGSHTVTGRLSRHATGRAFDIGGSPKRLEAIYDAIRGAYGGQIDELFYTPRGSIKNDKFYSPGHFNHAVEGQHRDHVHVSLKDTADAVTIRHVIEEHGTVGEASKRALYQAIKEVTHAVQHEHARTHPNHRNRR
jgi:hypothetical protein